jgi:N-ATPase, AtpR subunit
MQTALHVLAFFLIGIALGAGYFALLYAEVARLAYAASAREVILTHLMRLAAASLMFWLVAPQGAPALIATLTGFTLVLAVLRPLSTS